MILEQAIADSIDDFYQKALKEKNITPLGKPEAEIVEKPNPKSRGYFENNNYRRYQTHYNPSGI